MDTITAEEFAAIHEWSKATTALLDQQDKVIKAQAAAIRYMNEFVLSFNDRIAALEARDQRLTDSIDKAIDDFTETADAGDWMPSDE